MEKLLLRTRNPRTSETLLEQLEASLLRKIKRMKKERTTKRVEKLLLKKRKIMRIGPNPNKQISSKENLKPCLLRRYPKFPINHNLIAKLE